jgi:hypothetical protein
VDSQSAGEQLRPEVSFPIFRQTFCFFQLPKKSSFAGRVSKKVENVFRRHFFFAPETRQAFSAENIELVTFSNL